MLTKIITWHVPDLSNIHFMITFLDKISHVNLGNAKLLHVFCMCFYPYAFFVMSLNGCF